MHTPERNRRWRMAYVRRNQSAVDLDPILQSDFSTYRKEYWP